MNLFGDKWKAFPKHKPRKDGWYLCTVEVEGQQRYVMDLYYYSKGEKFLDNRVRNVFNSYNVYRYDGKRLHKDHLCDRTKGVKYWKKLPEPNMKGFEERSIYG